MDTLDKIQKEQERVIEICRFTWTMKAATEAFSFERDIYYWYLHFRPHCKKVYLPLNWTGIWHIVQNYPKQNVDELKELISEIYNSLESKIPYFTIASEVHCNEQSFPRLPLNVQVYGPGYNDGEDYGVTCHQIALVPFHRNAIYFNYKRDIFCSYFITGEYRCRKRLNDFLYGNEGHGYDGFVVTYRIPFILYCELLSRSIFALTPRGTNIGVYRLYEALQYGAIPVYISDKFSLPYSDEVEWNKIAVLINQNDIEKIPDILRKISAARIRKMQDYGKWFMQNYVRTDKISERLFAHANS